MNYTNIKKITKRYAQLTKPNTWASGLPRPINYPVLTQEERTKILNWDEPQPGDEPLLGCRAHQGKPTSIPRDNNYQYVPGDPIATVQTISTGQATQIRKQLEEGVTQEDICTKYDLRPEWLNTIIKNPKKGFFRW